MGSYILNYLRKSPLQHGKTWLAKYIDVPHSTNPTIYTNAMGVTFALDLQEYQMRQIYLFDYYERNTFENLIRLCHPAMTAVDVGANIGFYSLSLAKILKQGVVYAFEPTRETYQTLQTNLSLNSLNNIFTFPYGLSHQEGYGTLTYDRKNLGAASIFKTSLGAGENIQLSTLDLFCKTHQIENVDLIKVDIEGSELNFIEGAIETIRRSPKMVVAMEMIPEHCERAGYTADHLFQKMLSLGFTGYAPKSWPFKLKKLTSIPKNYFDNVIFLKGY